MLCLSQTTGHAIRALTCLAQRGEEASFIQDIAEGADVPHAYLAKIVKRLNDVGIVASKRGYRGGIWLARPPERINLLEIAEALDGPDFFSRCLLGSEFCSDERDCPTHDLWKMTRGKIKAELECTTIADVAAFYDRRGRDQAPPTRLESIRPNPVKERDHEP